VGAGIAGEVVARLTPPGPRQRGEIWWAATPEGGDRPVLVLTRDPVAGSNRAVVVAALTRTVRGLSSELPLGPEDGLPGPCVVSFDNVFTLRRHLFRRPVTTLSPERMAEACAALAYAVGCGADSRPGAAD
jgi:mRNA interferase MazF